jgi:hypothetical protein
MRRLVLVIASLALVVVAAPASAASPPEPVTITGTVLFPAGTGTFTATEPLCPSGTIQQLAGLFVGGPTTSFARIAVRHEFTCTDGSGSFVLQLTVRLDATGTTFRWSVLSGTGDYAKLHGTGTGTGSFITGGIVDTYTGAVHFD